MKYFYVLIFIIFVSSCSSTSTHNAQYHLDSTKFSNDNKGQITNADLQLIKKGQTKNKVIDLIGTPDLITNDNNKEIWIYDKSYTTKVVSKSLGEKENKGLVMSFYDSLFSTGDSNENRFVEVERTQTETVLLSITFVNDIVSEKKYRSSNM